MPLFRRCHGRRFPAPYAALDGPRRRHAATAKAVHGPDAGVALLGMDRADSPIFARAGTTCRPDEYLKDGGRYRRRRYSSFRRRGFIEAAIGAASPPLAVAGLQRRCMAACSALVRADGRGGGGIDPAWAKLLLASPKTDAAAGRCRVDVVRSKPASSASTPPMAYRAGRRRKARKSRWRRFRRGAAGRGNGIKGGNRVFRANGGWPALHPERAVVAASAGRCADDPGESTRSAAGRCRRASRHAGADVSRGGFPGRWLTRSAPAISLQLQLSQRQIPRSS